MVPAPGVVELCPLALPRLCVRMQNARFGVRNCVKLDVGIFL